MAVRIKDTTRAELCSIPVPASAVSNRGYTAISHKFVMDYALQELQNAGFNIQGESYRCTGDGNIAQGIYHLTYNNDPEIGMMFAWSNSYNKQMRFKCAIGGYVFVCMNGMLTGDMGTWNRKHTGSADEETEETILDQITNAHTYYNQLVSDKNKMKQILLTTKEQAGLLGILFAEYEILTTEQLSLVKEQMNKPSFAYNADKNSLWAFYNHVTLALKKSHPRTWMEDQRKLHIFIALEFDLYNFDPNAVTEDELVVEDPLLVNPAQTNLLDQLEEIENANIVVITGDNQERMIVVTNDDNLSMGPTPDVAEIDPTVATGGTVEPVEQGNKCVESDKSNEDNTKMMSKIYPNENGGIDCVVTNIAPEVAEVDEPGSDHDIDKDIPCMPAPEIDIAEPDFDRAVKIKDIDTSFTSDDIRSERGPSPDAAEIDSPLMDLGKAFHADLPLTHFDADMIVDIKSMTPDEILKEYGPQASVHAPDLAEIEEPTPQPAERDYPLRPEDCNPALPDAEGMNGTDPYLPNPDVGEVLPPMAGSVTERETLLESVQEGSSGDSIEGREISNVGQEPVDLGDDKTIVLDYGDNNPIIGVAPDVADLNNKDLINITLDELAPMPEIGIQYSRRPQADVAEVSLGEILIDEHSKIEDNFDFSLSDDEDAGELDFEL